jgi:hypothetical protein
MGEPIFYSRKLEEGLQGPLPNSVNGMHCRIPSPEKISLTDSRKAFQNFRDEVRQYAVDGCSSHQVNGMVRRRSLEVVECGGKEAFRPYIPIECVNRALDPKTFQLVGSHRIEAVNDFEAS